MVSSLAEPGVEVERLTWSEICDRYPNEWVVLVDIDWIDDINFDFTTAVVLGHSTDGDKVLVETRPLRPEASEWAHLFTGPVFVHDVPEHPAL